MLEYFFSCISNLTKTHLAGIIALAYVKYYLDKIVKTPILAVKEGPFKYFLLNNIPTLSENYWPTIWSVESRTQTFIGSFIRSLIFPNIDYRREILKLKDGGEIALDWLETNCGATSPIIVILPGLTGESQVQYVKCVVTAANNIGIRTVVFNNRGLGGMIVKTPRLYCSANGEDLSEVLIHVRTLYPKNKIGATGFSMGGVILTNYLANYNEEARQILTAANVISPTWDVLKSAESMQKPILNRLLNRYLAGCLCQTLKKCDIFQGAVDIDFICKSKTIREFDDRFTATQFGYKNVDEYYQAATLVGKLHQITVPLIGLSAADDPFQPLEAIPVEEAANSTHVAIAITSRGGHIGFIEGFCPFMENQYLTRLFTQFFMVTLFDYKGEFETLSHQLYRKYHDAHLQNS